MGDDFSFQLADFFDEPCLGGGFKYFLFSSLFGEDCFFTNIFQMG